MQQTHTHKAVTGRVEAKNLLSRRRQSEYRYSLFENNHLFSCKTQSLKKSQHFHSLSLWTQFKMQVCVGRHLTMTFLTFPSHIKLAYIYSVNWYLASLWVVWHGVIKYSFPCCELLWVGFIYHIWSGWTTFQIFSSSHRWSLFIIISLLCWGLWMNDDGLSRWRARGVGLWP